MDPIIVFFVIAAITTTALAISHLVAVRNRVEVAAQDIRFAQMRLSNIERQIGNAVDQYGELSIGRRGLEQSVKAYTNAMKAWNKADRTLPSILVNRFAKLSEASKNVDTNAIAIVDVTDAAVARDSVLSI